MDSVGKEDACIKLCFFLIYFFTDGRLRYMFSYLAISASGPQTDTTVMEVSMHRHRLTPNRNGWWPLVPASIDQKSNTVIPATLFPTAVPTWLDEVGVKGEKKSRKKSDSRGAFLGDLDAGLCKRMEGTNPKMPEERGVVD